MLYDYQFPMRLLRQSSLFLLTEPVRAALTQGLISTLVFMASAAEANTQGARAAEKPQDTATTEGAEVEPEAVDVLEPEPEPEAEPEAGAEPEPEPEPEPEAEAEPEADSEPDEESEADPELVDPTLSFNDVSWSVEYELDDSGHRLLPLLKLSGRVTNASNETLGADALPQLSFMDGREFLSLILDGSEELQPGETKFMSVSRAFPVWDKWSFAFRKGEIKAILNGLDGVAEAITQEFARMADGIEDAQKALEQEKLSKGFVFEDVVYDVENVEDVDGDSHFMAPMLEMSAKVTNTSDEKRDASSLPVLEFANKSKAFSLDSDFEGGETKDVSLSILFGQSPDECVFSFSEDESKPAYTGLEGVGDELTKQLADAIAHLPEDRAELEAAIATEQAEFETQTKLEEEAEQEKSSEFEEQQIDPVLEPEPVAEPEPEDEDEPVCWIATAGEKYHLDPNCRYVRGNELKEISIAEAIAMGRTVCKGCDR